MYRSGEWISRVTYDLSVRVHEDYAIISITCSICEIGVKEVERERKREREKERKRQTDRQTDRHGQRLQRLPTCILQCSVNRQGIHHVSVVKIKPGRTNQDRPVISEGSGAGRRRGLRFDQE